MRLTAIKSGYYREKRRIPEKEISTFLAASDLADLLGITVETVYRLARQNKLPHKRFGRTIRFYKKDFE